MGGGPGWTAAHQASAGLLRRRVAVDVLVEASGPRAPVPGDRPVGQGDPALLHVGTGVAVAVGGLSQIGPWYRVARVGPDAEGGVPDRTHPDVVAEERHGATAVLLVVRVGLD